MITWIVLINLMIKKLTSKDNFYSILIDEDITDENYSRAQNVWKTFKLKSMG